MGRANLRILMIYDVVPQTRDLPAIPVNSFQMSQGRAFGFPASDLVGEVLGSSPAPVSGFEGSSYPSPCPPSDWRPRLPHLNQVSRFPPPCLSFVQGLQPTRSPGPPRNFGSLTGFLRVFFLFPGLVRSLSILLSGWNL